MVWWVSGASYIPKARLKHTVGSVMYLSKELRDRLEARRGEKICMMVTMLGRVEGILEDACEGSIFIEDGGLIHIIDADYVIELSF